MDRIKQSEQLQIENGWFMFEAILFDFDGTLVDYVNADIQSLKWLHAQVGTPVCFDDFLKTSVDEVMKFHHLVANHEIDPLLMHDFRLKNTFNRHNIVWADDYVDIYRDKLLTTCTPFDGVEVLLSSITPKVKTGLITNAYNAEEQSERIKNSGLAGYFDLIVIAGDIGIYKPDAAIFLHALTHLDVSADKTLYIGDSVTYDITGAKSAGMKTVLFSKHIKGNSKVADYIVKDIAEMQKLLDRVVV